MFVFHKKLFYLFSVFCLYIIIKVMKKIYVCGPTVYSNVHVGNLRPIITFDFMLKAYQYLNIDYFFVHNITDIDDKIIKVALTEQKTEEKISQKYTREYLWLLKKLNISTISKIEKVTKNIDVLIQFIANLVRSGYAYQVKDGVIYNTQLNAEYGKLSNVKKDFAMQNEEVSQFKENDADFYLWKNTNIGIKYDSPWGFGRPGWHTECAALVAKNFEGETLDIHGGGIDLIFPHHENENAQYLSHYDLPIAEKWIHTGHINLNNVKMSKSLGNVLNAKEFIKKHGSDFLRLLLFSHKINSEINIDENSIFNTRNLLKKYKKIYHKFAINPVKEYDQIGVNTIMKSIANLDFHKALFEIDNIIKKINTDNNTEKNLGTIIKIFTILKFNFIFEHSQHKIVEKYWKWQKKINNKDYKNADILRAELIEKGWL